MSTDTIQASRYSAIRNEKGRRRRRLQNWSRFARIVVPTWLVSPRRRAADVDRDPPSKRELNSTSPSPSPNRPRFAFCITPPTTIDPTPLSSRRVFSIAARSGPRPNLQNSQPRRSVKRVCNKRHGLGTKGTHVYNPRHGLATSFCLVEREQF